MVCGCIVAGVVYTYTAVFATEWSQRQKLEAVDAGGGDRFGRSMGMYNNLLAVGAYTSDIGTTYDAGTGHVYIILLWSIE